MTVTLINKTRRMKTYNLPHDTYCKALGECACITLPGRDKRTVCSSVTLAAGAEVEGLQDAVLQVTKIAKDIKKGELQVKKKPSTAGNRQSADKVDTRNMHKKKKSKSTKAEGSSPTAAGPEH